jgi:hypothetical protein
MVASARRFRVLEDERLGHKPLEKASFGPETASLSYSQKQKHSTDPYFRADEMENAARLLHDSCHHLQIAGPAFPQAPAQP